MKKSMINIKNYDGYFRDILLRINNSDERSRSIIINIVKSLVVKVFSTVVTLALIPVSLHYIDKESYGVWLTIASVITWFSVFDFGLSNGLTNRLSEAFAVKDDRLAGIYLSTTYFILLLITAGLLVIYLFVSPFVNWNSVFSTKMDVSILRKTVHITFASFAFIFVLKPVVSLLMAKQKHFLGNIIQALGNLTALVLVFFMGPAMVDNKFVFFGSVLAFSYPFLILVFSIILYSSEYKAFRPSIARIDLSYSKSLFGLSLKFFIIQICVIVVLTGNNFLIAHFIDNSSVTYYNIAYRLYSIVSIFQLMFLQPLWNGFTHAYFVKDFDWIKGVIVKVNKMNFALCLGLCLLFLLHRNIYDLWIGKNIIIPFEIDLLLFIYFTLYLFMQTYVYFINGIGALNMQTMLGVVTIVMQYPLAYLLVEELNMGISGLLGLNIFWVVVSLALWRMQYKKIMAGAKLSKIWQ
jgi:O-antigen/teichoic acid export membrane protein